MPRLHRALYALLYIGIALALLLSGCREEPPPAPRPGLTGPISPSSDAGAAPDAPRHEAAGSAAAGPWSSCAWVDGSTAAVRRRDTLQFIDTAGRTRDTFRPDLSTWPEAPEPALWGESFCELLTNGETVLAHFGFFGNPAVMAQNGEPTLVDAALFARDGTLIRAFPPGASDGIAPLEPSADFAASLARRTRFVWVDEDLLAVSTGAQLWFYSLSADSLTLKADFSADVLAAWQTLQSQHHGLLRDELWAVNGALCFALGEGADDATGETRRALYTVEREAEPLRLSGDDRYTGYRVANGCLFAYLAEARVEADGTQQPLCRFWQVSADGAFTYVDTAALPFGAVHRAGFVASFDTLPAVEGEAAAYELRALDLATGERFVHAPTAENGGFPEGAVIQNFRAADIAADGQGVRFYYLFDALTGDEAPASHTLACYDTATGQTAFAELADGALSTAPGDEPAPAALLADSAAQTLAWIPLPTP